MATRVTGIYVGRDTTWLTARQTELQAAYSACLTAHQSYSRPGMSFSRVQFETIAAELAEVNYAIDVASGTRVNRTYADLSA